MWNINIKAPFGGFLRKYYLDDDINVGSNNEANDMKCISLNKSSCLTPGYTPNKTEETSEVIYKFSNIDSEENSYGISNTKVFQVGTSVEKDNITISDEYEDATVERNAITYLTDTKFIIFYYKDSAGYLKVGEIDEETEEITYGDDYEFTGYASSISMVRMSNTKFVVAYRGTSGYGYAFVGTVSGTVVSPEPAVQFDGTDAGSVSICKIDTSTVAIAYCTDNSSGDVIIGTVGTTISFGSNNTFNSADTNYISVGTLDSSKIIIGYKDDGGNDYAKAIVGTVSGSSVSFGTEFAVNSTICTLLKIDILSSTKAIIAYNEDGGGGGRSSVLSISGTTITSGSDAVFYASVIYDNSLLAINTTKFVVSYKELGGTIHYKIGTVSDTTITYGSEETLDSSGYDLYITEYKDTGFMLAYTKSNVGNVYLNSLGTWPHSISGAAFAGFWNNIVVYKDNLYYFWHTFSGGDIGKATSITTTPVFDDDWGSTEDDNLEEGDYTPLYVTLDNILIFGNGQYLGWYDGTTLDTKFYDFGDSLRIKSITEQGGLIYIAVNNQYSDLGYIYIIDNNIDSEVSILDMINVGDNVVELYTVNGIIYVFHQETVGENATKIGYISGARIIELDIFSESCNGQIEFANDILFFTSSESVLGLSTPHNSNQFLLTRPLDVVNGTILGGGGLRNTGDRLLHSYSYGSSFYVEFYDLTSKGIDSYWISKSWVTSDADTLSMIDSIFIKTNALEEDAKCNVEIYTNRSNTASKTLEISGENKNRHIFRKLGISGVEEFKIKLDFSVGTVNDEVEIQEIQIGGHIYQI